MLVYAVCISPGLEDSPCPCRNLVEMVSTRERMNEAGKPLVLTLSEKWPVY